ncbi:BRCA1-associated protein isoform X2 [Stomoxys calcitrans]|nr:BRCA1-associated protein isoform X2 [Stomoxys calcitrans]
MACQEKASLWACLSCAYVGCSRQKKGHITYHYKNTKHKLTMDLQHSLIWDFERKCFLDKNYCPKTASKKTPAEVEECKCPVCHYHQIPKMTNTQEVTTCMSCELRTDLWLCLQCNHIGCGRHQRGHALNHYNTSQHGEVMHLRSFSIWNYNEGEFVHRPYNGQAESKQMVSPTTVNTNATTNANANTNTNANTNANPNANTNTKANTNANANANMNTNSNDNDLVMEQMQDGFEERIAYLEHEWKNFGKLKETNRQMISVEQRLIALSEEKKLLEGKLREHDTKLNELLNQFKEANLNPLPSPSKLDNRFEFPLSPSTCCSVTGRSSDSKPLISFSVSDNLEQTQLIILFILLLFFYHFVNLFVQAVAGKA